jgi:hypothetical protein
MDGILSVAPERSLPKGRYRADLVCFSGSRRCNASIDSSQARNQSGCSLGNRHRRR